ncbi:2TM domain-containing protein [Janibacter sp. GXQ6167]|uniref:2TM domain-containing protein n=1 Tax=Janibacter sp. GXQ6167 TaxID=3240791 RepID=UPI0035240860
MNQPAGTSDELRARAIDNLEAKRAFYIHLGWYALLNIAFWVLWFTSSDRGEAGVPWPAWVTFGWGVGLVAHAVNTFGPGSSPSESKIQAEMRKLEGR